MELNEIEKTIIKRFNENIEDSGGSKPGLNGNTAFFSEVSDFDSQRFLEVLIDLEEDFDCELSYEDFFPGGRHSGKETITDIAKKTKNLISSKKKKHG